MSPGAGIFFSECNKDIHSPNDGVRRKKKKRSSDRNRYQPAQSCGPLGTITRDGL